MNTAISASTVSQSMITQYLKAVEVANEVLFSDITTDEVTVAYKSLNTEDNQE